MRMRVCCDSERSRISRERNLPVYAPNLISMFDDTAFGSMPLRAKIFAHVVDERNGFERNRPPFASLLPLLLEESTSNWTAVVDAMPFIAAIQPWGLDQIVKDLITDVAGGKVDEFDPLGAHRYYIPSILLGLFEAVARTWPSDDFQVAAQLDDLLLPVLTVVAQVPSQGLKPVMVSATDTKEFDQRFGAAIKTYFKGGLQRRGDKWTSLLEVFRFLQVWLISEERPHIVIEEIAQQIAYAAFGDLSTAMKLQVFIAWREAEVAAE